MSGKGLIRNKAFLLGVFFMALGVAGIIEGDGRGERLLGLIFFMAGFCHARDEWKEYEP